MTRRTRKFIGAVVMIAFVILYALVAMGLAQGRVTDLPRIWQTIAYATLGIGWIFPLMPLIRWMEREDRPTPR